MKSYIFPVLLIILSITGCDQAKSVVSGRDLEFVKNGVLELDKSLTVGQAIDNYKYFKSTKWQALKTDNGRRVVSVAAVVDTAKHPNMNSIPNLKQMEMKFQFVINQDSTFKVGWCGLAMEFNDGTKKEPDESVNLIQCTNSLKAIYNNSPDI